MLPPLNEKAFVHDVGIHNPQPTKVFGSTYRLPFHQPIFLLFACGVPEETTSVLIKTHMDALREAVETH